MITFPHASGSEVELDDFVYAWCYLVEKKGVELGGKNIVTVELPRLSSRLKMEELRENKREFSLEFLCRILVGTSNKNTAQATRVFMKKNVDFLCSDEKVINPVTGRLVFGARLIYKGPRPTACSPDVKRKLVSELQA